jgi:hypothetical protein
MSLARHPVSALLSNKNLSPQKLNTVYMSYPTVSQDSKPNGAFHNCHINVVDVWNYKYKGETVYVFNVFTTSVHDNLLSVIVVFTVTAERVQHVHRLPLPCVNVKKTLPFQCT